VNYARRWLIHSLAALSLFLALWTASAWAVRYWLLPNWISVNVILIANSNTDLRIFNGYNYVFITYLPYIHQPVVGPLVQDASATASFERQFPLYESEIRNLAIGLERESIFNPLNGRDTMIGTRTSIKIGFGYFPLLFSLLPITVWLIPFIRWSHNRLTPKLGFCNHCGYDLRATPDRCPECGRIPVKSPAATT